MGSAAPIRDMSQGYGDRNGDTDSNGPWLGVTPDGRYPISSRKEILMRHLLRIIGIVASVVAAFSMAAAPASAAGSGNPHFNRVSASASGSDLTVYFKEVGLGSGTTVTIVVRAHWDAQFACYNNGGKHPSATNKESFSGDSSASGEFTSDKNGTISDHLTVSAPTVSNNDFSCPPGQTEVLTYIQWSNISVTDSTSPAYADVPGTFTFGSMV
jgi:hypothetical protein